MLECKYPTSEHLASELVGPPQVVYLYMQLPRRKIVATNRSNQNGPHLWQVWLPIYCLHDMYTSYRQRATTKVATSNEGKDYPPPENFRTAVDSSLMIVVTRICAQII